MPDRDALIRVAIEDARVRLARTPHPPTTSAQLTEWAKNLWFNMRSASVAFPRRGGPAAFAAALVKDLLPTEPAPFPWKELP